MERGFLNFKLGQAETDVFEVRLTEALGNIFIIKVELSYSF